MSGRTIRFSFDYISNNAYLAWTQLPALAAEFDCTIEPVPVLFAGLLAAHGQLGPAEVPAKARWMAKNIVRKALRLGVWMSPPAFHPFNPLLALRVSSIPMDASARDAVIGALWAAVWVRGLHVSDPDVVVRVVDEVGLAGAALVAQAQEAEAKARLRRQTDDAIGRGVFGVPSMEVGDELFWGYDDFPHLRLFLAGEDPIDPAVWRQAYAPTPASAMRRQVRDRRR